MVVTIIRIMAWTYFIVGSTAIFDRYMRGDQYGFLIVFLLLLPMVLLVDALINYRPGIKYPTFFTVICIIILAPVAIINGFSAGQGARTSPYADARSHITCNDKKVLKRLGDYFIMADSAGSRSVNNAADCSLVFRVPSPREKRERSINGNYPFLHYITPAATRGVTSKTAARTAPAPPGAAAP